MKLSKFGLALILFFGSICLGVAGFMLIEDYQFLNAVYMSVITMSTVGFSEIHPLSDHGRAFTAAYIIYNMGIYAYTITIITQYLVKGEVQNTFDRIKKDNKIRKMKDHVIVCGYGRNGSKAAEELIKNNIPVVIIENHRSSHKAKEDQLKNVVFIEDNATSDEVLIQAGIKKAKAIITSLPGDADNVFIVLTAREMNPDILIISRASDPFSEKKLNRAGADYVVMPDYIGGMHMAGIYLKKENMASSEIATEMASSYQLKEVTLKELGSQYADKKLSQINNSLKGSMIVGYKKLDGIIIINPDEDHLFKENDILLLAGTITKTA